MFEAVAFMAVVVSVTGLLCGLHCIPLTPDQPQRDARTAPLPHWARTQPTHHDYREAA